MSAESLVTVPPWRLPAPSSRRLRILTGPAAADRLSQEPPCAEVDLDEVLVVRQMVDRDAPDTSTATCDEGLSECACSGILNFASS